MEPNNIIKCYTDASYSKELLGSVIGYKIGDSKIKTEYLEGINNTQAELIAIEKCIEKVKKHHPGKIIHIYTDCQKAIKVYNDNEDVVMHKMIGHIKKELRDGDQMIFSQVDRATSKQMRSKFKSIIEVKHE